MNPLVLVRLVAAGVLVSITLGSGDYFVQFLSSILGVARQ